MSWYQKAAYQGYAGAQRALDKVKEHVELAEQLRNDKAAGAALADKQLPNIRVSCETRLLGHLCTLTSKDTRRLVIKEVVVNGRDEKEACIARTTWLSEQKLRGDSFTFRGFGSCKFRQD